MVLNELGLEYKTEFIEFSPEGMKGPAFLKINPNGHTNICICCGTVYSSSVLGIPALIDHGNNDFTIWESAAIIQYLVDRYDKSHKLSFPIGTDEYYLVSNNGLRRWITNGENTNRDT